MYNSAKPYAESCEQNKQVILEQLQRILPESGLVLEIGSGTGQHAVYFAEKLPHLIWQPSDIAEHIDGITAWLDDSTSKNIKSPMVIDVTQFPWPLTQADSVFTANTIHIMSHNEVEAMFLGIGQVLQRSGVFCAYGPFNYNGNYTSDSNAQFDVWLKQRDARSGIKNFEDLQRLAEKAGLAFLADIAMPVNNRILVWRRLDGTEDLTIRSSQLTDENA